MADLRMLRDSALFFEGETDARCPEETPACDLNADGEALRVIDPDLAQRGNNYFVVNTANGDIVEWLRLDGAIRELFDVRVLPGCVCPMALPTFGPELASFVTIEAPDRPLGERGPP